MAQLRRDYGEFQSQGAEIFVIGPEDSGAFVRYWDKETLPFIGIPDPTHTVLKLYGQEIKLFKFGRMPAQVLVDKKGIARFVHYGHSMEDIPSNEELIDLLEVLNAE